MRLLSFREAEQLTGVRICTWRLWTAQRKIPVVRLGRLVKIRETDLEKFIERSLVPAAPERR